MGAFESAAYFAEAAERCRAIGTEFPKVGAELAAILPSLSQRDGVWLQSIYAGLTPHDFLSFPPEHFLADVRAAAMAREELGWVIPEELFLAYVLPSRVNNEYSDGSRPWLYEQLLPRVKGRSMLEAALEVNYWCCEQATYQSADERTIGPRGMCLRGKGRCGEESVLTAAALRAVGIPARQCYAPRWAHCDDNHAWVEFWADGRWYYMGGCEPEPVPDRGWFTSAASRAMVVRALVPDGKGGCRAKVVTDRYAGTAVLQVRVTENGLPVSGAAVRFQLINDSRLCAVYEAVTDADGKVEQSVGKGTLIVSAVYKGRLMEKLADLRQTQEIQLRAEEGRAPLSEEWSARWELTPPLERIPEPEDGEDALRLRRAEEVRKRREEAYAREECCWLRLAAGNRDEIARFLAGGQQEEKELLLRTLEEKDLSDTSCESLCDFLLAALPWREKYPEEIWRDWILAPRSAHEMLLPLRCELAAALAEKGLNRAEDVLRWMEKNLRVLRVSGCSDRRGDAAGYLRHCACPAEEWQSVAVQLCRALGIPARIDGVTGLLETWENGEERIPAAPVRVKLRLVSAGEPLTYREHFTLARWTGEDYTPLGLDGLVLDGEKDILLPPGSYRLTTNRRQIDGTASAQMESFRLTKERRLLIGLQRDDLEEKLQCTALQTVKQISLTTFEVEEISMRSRRGSLLLWLECGREPTEHLLLEMLELRAAFAAGGWPIRILLAEADMLNNATLQRVLETIPNCQCDLEADPEERYRLRAAMGVGDGRLPLSLVLDREGRGLHACANYNIRTAHTLLRILQLQ